MNRLLMVTVSVFVLIGLLVVPACGGTTPPVDEYNLTMAVSPSGSGNTTPSGVDAYEAGTEVNISATAADGWQFVNWTASAGSVAEPTQASTTYEMPAEAATVTANFEEVPTITFAVAGPMTFIQGKDHWAGAQMARDEINDAGGVDVGGVPHMVSLVQVETNEILDVTGADGTSALLSVIDDIDFVVGGFRTESVTVYREVVVGPGGVGKIFMNCGAATAALQGSVVSDYEDYKYWFKATPYNEVFLVTSVLKYTGIVNVQLRAALGLGEEDPPLDAAILMEDAQWSNPMQPYAEAGLATAGLNHIGTWKCDSYATDLETQLSDIDAEDPHIIFTILSGPPGKAYGLQQEEFAPNVFSLGINVEAQDISYHDDTGAEYHMTLDTWAEEVEVTPYALDFFDAFVAEEERYPTYCAAAYDAIYSIVEGVEAVSAAEAWDDIADVIDHANIDALIEYLETTPRMGVGANTGYYPLPDGVIPDPLTLYLTFEQASAIYPHLVESDPGPGEWEYDLADFTTQGGFIAHDTIYGPGWQTGIGAQWQPVDSENPDGPWRKVAVWPTYLGEIGDTLLDNYGDWNFAYPGTQTLGVDPDWVAYHSS